MSVATTASPTASRTRPYKVSADAAATLLAFDIRRDVVRDIGAWGQPSIMSARDRNPSSHRTVPTTAPPFDQVHYRAAGREWRSSTGPLGQKWLLVTPAWWSLSRHTPGN